MSLVPGPIEDKDMPVWAVRLEGKVDAVISLHEQKLAVLDEAGKDHEIRIRVLENRKTVSPAQLWTAVAGGVATLGVLATLVFNAIDHLPGVG